MGLPLLLVTYVLTDQPLELYRFVWFATVGILIAFVSDAQGLLIGSTCNVTVRYRLIRCLKWSVSVRFCLQNGSVLAAAVGIVETLFCMYGVGFGNQISSVMKTVLNLSFLRVGTIAILKVTFEDRSSLDCIDEILCYYQEPKDILRDLGIIDASYVLHVLGLIGFFVIFRLSAFLILKYRLTSKVS